MKTGYLSKMKQWGTANEPVLWLAAGVASWTVATVWSAKAAIDANKKLEAEMAARGVDKLPTKDILKIAGPKFIPSIILAGTGTACLMKGNNVNVKRIAGMSSLLTMAERKAESVAEATVETVGKKKAEDISAKASQKEIQKDIESGKLNEMDVQKTGRGIYLFKLEFTGQYFRSTIDEVQRGLNRFNKSWGGTNGLEYQALADLTDEWGIDRCECATLNGWHRDDLSSDGVRIEKDTCIGLNDEPCYTLIFPYGEKPRNNFYEPRRRRY